MDAFLVLREHPAGVDAETGTGSRVVYDLARDAAYFGAAAVAGPALAWELLPTSSTEPQPAGVTILAGVELAGSESWLMRCDRVDFPPGAVAYRHVHPGPGIRRLLFGELTITTGGVTTLYREGDAWVESGPEPVYAESSPTEATAFVRVMLLPTEWAGKRTIRYTNPADANRPAHQRAHVYLEELLQQPPP